MSLKVEHKEVFLRGFQGGTTKGLEEVENPTLEIFQCIGRKGQVQCLSPLSSAQKASQIRLRRIVFWLGSVVWPRLLNGGTPSAA